MRLLRDGDRLTALWSVDTLVERAEHAERASTQVCPYRTYVIAEYRRDGSTVTIQNYPCAGPGSGHVALAFTSESSGARFLARLGELAHDLVLRQTTGDRVVALASALGVDGIVVDPFGPGVPAVVALA